MKTNTHGELNNIDSQLINLALQEDLGLPYQDVTTQLLFKNRTERAASKIISKHSEPIVICGLPIIEKLLTIMCDRYEIKSDHQDGDILTPGGTLLTLTAPAPTILMLERTMLNFLQHLCAVATQTAKFVNLIQHTATKILDTRKTIPGFRHLDKYAVQCGGGVNHRMGLYDAIMIKDTHIDCLGNIALALENLPDNILQTYPVIVEVRNKEELAVVLAQGLHKVSRVLLDNMTLDGLSECVAMCENKMVTESSGNVRLDNVVKIAETRVDFISIGKLTHSPDHVDLSMVSC